jgi:hypothetical protein
MKHQKPKIEELRLCYMVLVAAAERCVEWWDAGQEKSTDLPMVAMKRALERLKIAEEKANAA